MKRRQSNFIIALQIIKVPWYDSYKYRPHMHTWTSRDKSTFHDSNWESQLPKRWLVYERWYRDVTRCLLETGKHLSILVLLCRIDEMVSSDRLFMLDTEKLCTVQRPREYPAQPTRCCTTPSTRIFSGKTRDYTKLHTIFHRPPHYHLTCQPNLPRSHLRCWKQYSLVRPTISPLCLDLPPGWVLISD